jgi:hypothetical protein
MLPDRTLPATSGMRAAAAALSLSVLAILVGWLSLRTHAIPVPAPGAKPASGFVAARALAHVNALAQAPRPVGSRANAAARDYIAAQVRALGLVPDIQTETVQTTAEGPMRTVHVTLATVHNIVVHKAGRTAPGRRSGSNAVGSNAAGSNAAAGSAAAGIDTPAILATAHYDSGSATLGAADGAMSAAAMLETLRVLQAGPPLDNDVLFVFTDADSGQALGTRGFMASHPWANRVRLLLRFDNPGNRGPLALVNAAHADSFALAAFARAAPAPQGTSFMAELYADIRPRPADGLLAGGGADRPSVLQFATSGGTLGSGAVHDIPQRVSGASLQHEGDTMLALLRDAGNRPLPVPVQGTRGQVFFGVPGLGILHYSYALVWPLTILACVLTVAACGVGIRRARIDSADIIHAGFNFLFMGAFVTFIVHLCCAASPGLAWRWHAAVLADDEGIRWQVLAFALLLAAGFIVVQRRLQERLGAPCMLLGVICVATLALAAVSWGAPGASYLLAWPLLAAQAALLVLLSTTKQQQRRRRILWLVLAALPAAVLIVPALRDSLTLLSPAWLVLPAALVFTLLGLCGMLLHEAGARFVVRPLLLAAAASIGLAWTTVPQVPEMPAPNALVYFKDTPSWRAFWLYPPVPLDPWTRSVFPNTMHPYQLPYLFGPASHPVWYAAAPREDAIAYPHLIIEKVAWIGDTKHVEFLLRSKNRAPHIALRIDGAGPKRTSVNGRVLTGTEYFGWRLDLHGMEDQDLRFAFDFDGDPKFTVFIQEYLPGVPEGGLPPRPIDMRPRLLPLTGTTISADILRFE